MRLHFFLGMIPLVCLARSAFSSDIEAVLRLTERVPMEALAAAVTDPQSPRYGKFYSPEEIREVAGPSDADYTTFVENLQSQGFQVVSETKTHLFMTVKAPKEVFEVSFRTKIQFVNKKRTRHISKDPARVPESLNLIASVIGLDNTRVSKPLHHIGRKGNSQKLGDGYEPSTIHELYGFDPIYKAGLSGKGQHIAIATYDGFYLNDVVQYYAYENINPQPKVDVLEFNGMAYVNSDSAMETALDAEFSGMIAPGAQIHVFTSALNNDPGEVQLFTTILDDNRAKVANYSWGDCEANVSQQHFQDMTKVFARAVAQGVNIVAAAGDWGAYGCPSSRGKKSSAGKYNADWPAANPYVVAVGGTSVDISHGELAETAWDSTGGGVSSVFALPSWQTGFPSPFVRRSFPDVAFNADPNTGQPAYVHNYQTPEWFQFGGTSIGAPQWSGFLALVGEARGGAPLGFLNPIIYAMSAEQHQTLFHDVVKGNNGGFKAGSGWDATTGWGSMRASPLLDALRNH